MATTSENHDQLVNNIAKVLTTVVIAMGIALVIAMFVYTV